MANIRCLVVDDEPTARDILGLLLSQLAGTEVVGFCKNALEAMEHLRTQQVDLVFLDINMPEMSGIALAKIIPKATKVIFTTAYREYAVEGFDLQAVDYLLKPIGLDRLAQAVQKYSEESALKAKAPEYLLVRADRKMVKLKWAEVAYVESLSDYVKVHTPEQTIVTRETISAIEEKAPEGFVRIHRSYLVAEAFISAFTSEYVEVLGQTLTISRSYRQEFLARFS